MRRINFVKSGKRKLILKDLKRYFGVDKIPGLLVETSGKKIRGFSGSMNREEIEELAGVANVEIVGMSLLVNDQDFRLSFDATQLFAEDISENILELDNDNFDNWISGKSLDLQKEKKVFVIKHKNDFLGCGISDGKKIQNLIPKERRQN